MSRSEEQRWRHVDEELKSKYEIFDVLGGGGMGRVLRARHRQLKRWVAIKLLQQEVRSDEAVPRFMREARAAAQIRSTHVAQVLDAGILESGQPFIVMEFLQGQDLARMVSATKGLPVETAVGFVLQALEALAEAHSLQIIHRDIKPGNLFATQLVAGEIGIKVLDFGLAKTNPAFDTLDPSVTERGAVLGTPSYMAPEQFVNAQDADVRADIWGIGATLFELLTGVPPFTGGNLPQVYTAVMHSPIPTLRSAGADLPDGLEAIVSTCLARDKERRYANVAELAVALEPFAAASARIHIERIRRLLDGSRSWDSEPSVPIRAPGIDAAIAADDRLRDPSEARGLISSTFARDSDPSEHGGAATGPIKPRRWRWLAVAVVSLLSSLGGLYLWRADDSRASDRAPAPEPAPATNAPLPSAPRVQSTAAPQQRPPALAPLPPLAPLPAAPSSTHAQTATRVGPPIPERKQTASKKRMRPAATSGGSEPNKAQPSSLYEKYP